MHTDSPKIRQNSEGQRCNHLLGDFNTTCNQLVSRNHWNRRRLTSSPKHPLDVSVDGELASSQCTNHEQSSTNTCIAAPEAELLSDLNQSACGTLTRKTLGLVDLGQHSVGRLRNESRGKASNQTRAQVDDGLGAVGRSVLVDRSVDLLCNLLVDDELGHSVWDLLEENGTEPTVESSDTFLPSDLAETGDETRSEGGFGDESDTGGFKRAKGNIGKEFGGSGGGEIDGSSVVRGRLIAKSVDRLLLEELVSTKLECALQEVSSKGWADAREESTCAFILDNFSETADHASVVGNGVKLYSRLDAGSR